jgi:hypothetical protein
MPSTTIPTTPPKLLWWLVTLLAGIVLSMAGAWAMSTHQDVRALQTEVSTLKEQLPLVNHKLDLIMESLGVTYTRGQAEQPGKPMPKRGESR